MARTYRIACRQCGQQHFVDELELFGSTDATDAVYVADTGAATEHRIRIRRPPPSPDRTT